MSQYALSAVKINATVIPVATGSHDPGVEALLEGAASSIDTTQAAVRGCLPKVTFSTPALATALGVCGVNGLAITTPNILTLYYAKLVSGAALGTGTTFISVVCNEGLLVLDGIPEADYIKAAFANYTLYATYNGTNEPLIVTADVAGPTVNLLSELFTPYAATLTVGALTIPVSSIGYDAGISAFQERAAASTRPTFAAIMEQKPTVSITSQAIKTVLDKVGINGSVATETAVTLYYAKMATAGFATAGNDISITINDPLVVFDGINPTHNGKATIGLKAYGIFDGTNAPVAQSVAATRPAVNALAELWTGGPIIGDGTTYQGRGWSFDLGLTVLHDGHSGDHRPTYACIAKRSPRFETDILDLASPATFGVAATSYVFYLRRVAEGGSRSDPDTGTNHISFTVTAGLVTAGAASGQWGDMAAGKVIVYPVQAGANEIVAIDTTANIV